MKRSKQDDLQTRQDICRAQFFVALARGLTQDESVEVLKHRAAAERLSVHAVALAVLSTDPIDEILLAPSPEPPRRPAHRHLHALDPERP